MLSQPLSFYISTVTTTLAIPLAIAQQVSKTYWDDIVALRKTRSLAQVSVIYGGYVSRALIHYYEQILTK